MMLIPSKQRPPDWPPSNADDPESQTCNTQAVVAQLDCPAYRSPLWDSDDEPDGGEEVVANPSAPSLAEEPSPSQVAEDAADDVLFSGSLRAVCCPEPMIAWMLNQHRETRRQNRVRDNQSDLLQQKLTTSNVLYKQAHTSLAKAHSRIEVLAGFQRRYLPVASEL